MCPSHVDQDLTILEKFKAEIGFMIGTTTLGLSTEAPADPSGFTSMAVDETTFAFLQITVNSLSNLFPSGCVKQDAFFSGNGRRRLCPAAEGDEVD